jgi:hypothetical protein
LANVPAGVVVGAAGGGGTPGGQPAKAVVMLEIDDAADAPLWDVQPRRVELAAQELQVCGVHKRVLLLLENQSFSAHLSTAADGKPAVGKINLSNISGRSFLDYRCWFDPKTASKVRATGAGAGAGASARCWLLVAALL